MRKRACLIHRRRKEDIEEKEKKELLEHRQRCIDAAIKRGKDPEEIDTDEEVTELKKPISAENIMKPSFL